MDINQIKDHIQSLANMADTYQKRQEDTIFGTPEQLQKSLYMILVSTRQLLAEIEYFGRQNNQIRKEPIQTI